MNNRGITLIEFILVFAVLALLFSVAIPRFGMIRERQVLKAAASDIVSSLNKARSSTLSSVNSSSYGVNFTPDEIMIFNGTTFSAGASGNESILLSAPAQISNVTLNGTSGTTGNLYFHRLSGEPSKSGTVTVSTPNFSQTITISPTGAFNAN